MDEYLDEEFESYNEESEEDLSISNLKNFSSAVIWGTDWTVETIISQLEKYNIDLNPKFQRRDAWTEKEKSRLIESLMLGIPVPPIILAERKDIRGKYIVIDGKQRLLTLRQFYSENEEFNALSLKNLQFLKELNGKNRLEIKQDYENSHFLNQLDNQTIRAIVIKNWPNEEFLFTVFLRLNTGSKKLSPQELRQALHPGPFLDYLDEQTAKSKAFHNLLNNQEADPRMRDVELALRYYAFKFNLENNKGNLKDFLDSTCNKLNIAWDSKKSKIEEEFTNLEQAINLCFEIFGEKEAFSRYIDGKYNKRFNRPLFEVFTYYLSDNKVRESLEKKKGAVKLKFEELSLKDAQFNESIASTTKELGRVEYRFKVIKEILSELVEHQLPEIIKFDSYLKKKQ